MSSPPVLRLPLELLTSIIGRLELQDTVRLAMTNRYFRSVIEAPTHEQFLEAENDDWAVSKGLYTCQGCITFRRLETFSDDMRKGRLARRGPDAARRLCIECGVRIGRYTEGAEISILGLRYLLRRRCRGLTDHTNVDEASNSSQVQMTWVQVPTSDSQRSEDDWAHSSRFFAEDRHAEELYGVWPDI